MPPSLRRDSQQSVTKQDPHSPGDKNTCLDIRISENFYLLFVKRELACAVKYLAL